MKTKSAFSLLLLLVSFFPLMTTAEEASPENVVLARSFTECASLITIFTKIMEEAGGIKPVDKVRLNRTVTVFTLYGFALVGKNEAMLMLRESAKNEGALVKAHIDRGEVNSYADNSARRIAQCTALMEQHHESLQPKLVEMLKDTGG